MSSARIGARRSRGAAESKVSFGRGVERGLLAIDSHTGNFIARDALLGAVVLLAIFITFDFNNNDSMRSGDLEGTLLGGDVVVLSLRVALKPVLVNHVAGTADLKLTAGNSHEVQTLIANKSAVSDVITIVGQSGAAVRLIIAFCGKLNVDRLNNEPLDTGNVATLAIVHRRRDADIHNSVLADIHGIDLITVSGPVAVRLLVFDHKAVAVLIDCGSLARNVMLAVVGFLNVGCVQRHIFIDITRAHSKRAVAFGDVVVLLFSVTPIEIKGIVLRSNILDRSEILIGNALTISKAIRAGVDIHLLPIVIQAIVGEAVRLGNENHIALIDNELAVNRGYIELRSDIVALGILHHGGADHLIVVLARIGGGDTCAQAFNGEGCTLVVGKGGISHARNSVHVAVIGLGVRLSGNRNLVLILIGASVDYQFAKLERDLVVIKVSTLGISRFKLILVRSRKNVVLVVPGELVFGENAIIAHKAVAAYLKVGTALQRLTIVVLVAVLRRKRNGTLINLEFAIGHNEFHVGIVFGSIAGKRELFFIQVHWVGASISSLDFRGTIGSNVILAHARRKARHIITIDSLLLAVILLATLVAGNRDGDLVVNGANMQITRGHLGDNIVIVGAHLAHGAVGKRIGIVTSIGTLAAIERNAVEGSDRSFAQISRVPVDALLRAVIGLGVGVRRKRHVLVVVELDNVFVFIARKRETFRTVAYRGMTAERFGRNAADGIAALAVSIVGFKRLTGTVPVVFNFVVNGIRRVVEIDRSIGTHDAHLGFTRYRSVSGNSDRLLRDRLTLHISGKGLRRGNRLRRSLEIVVHLD